MGVQSNDNVIKDLKTRELILYIADRLKTCEGYGATLLNKALYLIDNLSYLKFRKPVSKLTYVRQDKGATPAPWLFLSIKDDLIRSGEMNEIKADFFGLVQKRLEPLRPPNVNYFEKEEIALIDGILHALLPHNATSITNYSHKFMSWKITDNLEELPFHSFLLTSRVPNQKDIEWAEKEIKKSQNSE